MDETATKILMMAWDESLRFTKEGAWLHDGAPVLHEGVSDFFSNHLQFDEEHQCYVVASEGRCVRAIVDDTPVVVRTLRGDEKTGWTAVLSGGAEEEFAVTSLSVSGGTNWYCATRSATTRARLLRPAVQHLLPFIDEQDGRFFIRFRGENVPILNE